ncbi:hypothetical protein DIPPA_25319 [Diplonema papillatum]|nr:hypothetical protein DIPPA_25319 [Diplonema papillatum]
MAQPGAPVQQQPAAEGFPVSPAKPTSGVVEPLDTAVMDEPTLELYRLVKLLVANTLAKYFQQEQYFNRDRERYFKHVRYLTAKLFKMESPSCLEPSKLPRVVSDICEYVKSHVSSKVDRRSKLRSAARERKRRKLDVASSPSPNLEPPLTGENPDDDVSVAESAVFEAEDVFFLDDSKPIQVIYGTDADKQPSPESPEGQ